MCLENSYTYNLIKSFIFTHISHYLLISIITASGGYDNGTSTGKGLLGLDLTLNPFNYFKDGQSYVVVSYGLSNNFDFHCYYSKPYKDYDNYYAGIFYQIIRHKNIDLATAFGIRKYRKNKTSHLFVPQVLYTIPLLDNIKIGGSIVNVVNIHNYNYVGHAIDIAIIIPLLNNSYKMKKIENINFCVGVFKPTIYNNYKWLPTYSFDFRIKI